MRRLFFITLFLLAAAAAASAQFADGGTLKRAGGKIKLDGRKLTAEEQALLLSDIGGIDYNDAWNRAASRRRVGNTLTIAGSSAIVLGTATTVVGALTSAIGAVAGATGGALVGSIGGEEAAKDLANEGAEAGAKAGDPIIAAGVITAGVGIAALATGIPLLVGGCKRLNHIVAGANQARGSELSLGPAPGGFGLTYRF